MIDIFLQTKLFPPPLRQQLVPRPHVEEKLKRSLSVPLTLVSAPAGFGKTTAVAVAAQRLEEEARAHVAWLSLEKGDDDPGRFWHYFTAALQTAFPASDHRMTITGEAMINALEAPQPMRSLLGTLLNEIAINAEKLLCVLDDTHLITEREIHDGLAFLLEHAPPNLHLLLVTRADPPLPLHRLRARGQLVELRAADLRFDSAETSAFLRQGMGLSLEDAEVAQLNKETEGWPAGLHLAGLALQGTSPDERRVAQPGLIERLARSNHYVAEYLTQEVLAQQTERVQAFLLQTSILDRLCGPLCDAVTQESGSQELLEMLVRQNLFLIPLSPAGSIGQTHSWYRYHHLFANLLQGHLRQQPEPVLQLHRRAAVWHASQGDVEAAVEYALDGEDYSQVVQLLNEHARSLAMQGQALTLERWLGRLPPAYQAALPQANLAFAWALLVRGRYAEVEPYLQRAEEAAGPDDKPLRGESEALRAVLADTRGQTKEALAHAQEAIALVPENDLFIQALAYFALAGAHREGGDVDAAIAAYEQSIPLCGAAQLPLFEMLGRAHLGYLYMIRGLLRQAETTTRPVTTSAMRHPAASAAQSALGMVLLERYQLVEAEHHLQQAISLAQQSGHNAALVLAHIALSRLRRAQEDMDGARDAVEIAGTNLQRGGPAWMKLLLLAEQVRLLLDQGAVSPAQQLLAQVGQEIYPAEGHVRELLPLARARVLYHLDHLVEARELLDGVVRTAKAGGRQGRVIEGLLLRALIHDAQGNESAARDDLQRALKLAQPEGYVLLFVEADAPMASLLARLDSPYARRLLAAFAPAVREQAVLTGGLPDPLTERERQVLQLMAQGLTYKQIADELIVSVNTVRHHVRNIYSKLEVNKRSQALNKARALALL